jgi:hypothetical protein
MQKTAPEQPIIFVDVALGNSGASPGDEHAVRIAIYKDSDPLNLALTFIREQHLSEKIYLDELVFMLKHAKEKALQEADQSQ